MELAGDFVEDEEQPSREQSGGWKGEDPGHGNIADRGHLEATLVGCHCSGDTGA